ncbi:cell division protein FtsL [Cohnella terricola]|uniref:Cell division protein FtsL n=1 Tax=Cohnella terricola TaxID=1289167 RepID=A0A559JL23_9BACL|nr:cell division protein FtsL [Cohnella terricola]TVY00576.1 cell division protein FtsL [Cohnella terricola]
MAYYGNLALRPERTEEQQVKSNAHVGVAKTKVTLRRSIPIGEKLIYLFTIGLIVFVAGLIIYRYAQIYQINVNLQGTNKTYNQVSEQSKELQKEIELLSDPNRIKEIAMKNGYVPVTGDSIVASKDDRNAMAMKQR